MNMGWPPYYQPTAMTDYIIENTWSLKLYVILIIYLFIFKKFHGQIEIDVSQVSDFKEKPLESLEMAEVMHNT